MLKGISDKISPELLKVLCQMGHGDELVISDAHFPADTYGKRVLRADGLKADEMLNAILPLFEIDEYVPDPIVMMQAVKGDTLDESVEARYKVAIKKHAPNAPEIHRMERFAFYERAKSAYAVLITGELAKYGNIIIKKGVTPCS